MAKLPRPYFPEKPVKLDYIYFHVGRAITWWACAEEGIEACVDLLAKAAPDPLYVRPTSTKQRIVAFKRLAKRVPLSDPQRDKGKKLIQTFGELSHLRHWLAHGTSPKYSFIGETWRKNGSWVTFERRHPGTGEWMSAEAQLADIEWMADRCLRLNSNIWNWITVDLGCATPKKTEHFLRKIRVRAP
jgi:hypothetical protein